MSIGYEQMKTGDRVQFWLTGCVSKFVGTVNGVDSRYGYPTILPDAGQDFPPSMILKDGDYIVLAILERDGKPYQPEGHPNVET